MERRKYTRTPAISRNGLRPGTVLPVRPPMKSIVTVLICEKRVELASEECILKSLCTVYQGLNARCVK